MSVRTQHDDPAWSPGKSTTQGPRTSQRSSRPGRRPVPSPTAEELHDMSATEKAKVARRVRNREGAQRSKDQKNLEQQVIQLQRENTRLRNQLTTNTAEMDKIKTEFEEYKAQQQRNISPFSSSSYYLHGTSLGPPLHPDDPMNPLNNYDNNGNNNGNSNITNPSTPTTDAAAVHLVDEGLALPAHPPHLCTAATAPTAIGEPDLHSVMQWKYPGYYDSNMQYHPYACYNTHHLHGTEMEEPPLVFTPFAAVTSPREALLSPGGGGNGHTRVTEFSAWRPRDPGLGNHHISTTARNNSTINEPSMPWWGAQTGACAGGRGEQQQHARENSNTARELARMMSSPAAFNGGDPLFASD
ncbi:hypothetical protein Ndes2526B_g02292 [Nannochloris sp. 'desiccata']|nr:hypothetical protein KSW81_003373 [Chlorella desiccata (nom. nud.)]KAH7622998.1 hypothetical protein NADE_007862 [Chlorella desiccata (nom. nud.)]